MYPVVKRIFDFLAALVAILLLSPLLIPIMIGLKMTGEGYIFYFQKRIGLHQRRFDIWKFATMLKDSPNLGTGIITMRNDPRITPMGKFLRKTKINELPQLFNILKGDISVVGPRPLVDKTFNAYPPEIRAVIYNVKPGLTGIGSIIFRDEEGLFDANKDQYQDPHQYYESVIAPYKGALEMWYQKRQSFYVDLMIIFLTAWVIVAPQSQLAYQLFPDLPERTF